MPKRCPDCGENLSRRQFMKTAAAAAAVAAWAPSIDEDSEALVAKFYKTLTDAQKKEIVLPWSDKRRTEVQNNWHVTPIRIGRFFDKKQQALLKDIFRGLLSDDGAARLRKSMKDDSGGFQNYSCPVFGEPGTKQWEWVMTGRHLTIRCDGNTTRNYAFGGPIFYGHATTFREGAKHKGNVWWPQAQAANKLFQALAGEQRKKALIDKSPRDRARAIQISVKGPFQGLAFGDLDKDTKPLAENIVKSLLGPFRKRDTDEAMKMLKKDGLDKLHIAFFKDEDIGDDGVWDNWRIQGPSMAWYFRGHPHVHTWAGVKQKKVY